MTDGPARRLAEAIGRHGLAAPARMLLDAHRPLEPLVSDLGAALGPLAAATVGASRPDTDDAIADAGTIGRLIDAIDADTERRSRAEPG